MNPEYTMRWGEPLPPYKKLFIEKNGGCPVQVAEVWLDDVEGVFCIETHRAFNYEEPRLGRINDIEDVKAAVERWLLERWGLEQAYLRVTGVQP